MLPSTKGTELKVRPDELTILMAEFLAIKVRAGSRNTLIAYQSDLQRLGNFTMGDFSQPKLLRFKLMVVDKDRDGRARPPRTANRILSVCRKFLRFLQEKGVLSTNYLEFIEGQRIDKMDSPYIALNDDEVRSMLEWPRRDELVGASQRLCLILAFYLGLRVSEMIAIRHADIVDGKLLVRGKGRRVRTIPLPGFIVNEINSYISLAAIEMDSIDINGPLLVSQKSDGKNHIVASTVWKWFKSIAQACGITKHISPHCARATAITKALDNGVSIRDVAILAGHASVETTSIYDKRRGEASMAAVKAIKY